MSTSASCQKWAWRIPARSTSDLYCIVSLLAEKGVSFKVIDDPSIDTSSRTGKLVMGILALVAEFENEIRRERQMDGIAKAKERGVRFGRKSLLLPEMVKEIRTLRKAGRMLFEHRSGKHDDLIFAIAMPLWWSTERRKRRLRAYATRGLF